MHEVDQSGFGSLQWDLENHLSLLWTTCMSAALRGGRGANVERKAGNRGEERDITLVASLGFVVHRCKRSVKRSIHPTRFPSSPYSLSARSSLTSSSVPIAIGATSMVELH